MSGLGDGDPGFHPGQTRSDRVDGVREAGMEDDRLCVCVVEQIHQLFGAIAIVGVDRLEAAFEGREVALEILRAVVEVPRHLGSMAHAFGDEVGGHHVSGHVDVSCTVIELARTDENFFALRLSIPSAFRKWLIPKGSIAIRGVSLTVAKLEFSDAKDAPGEVEIMLVPHTLIHTNLGECSAQTFVEVEFDHMIKSVSALVENLLPLALDARQS